MCRPCASKATTSEPGAISGSGARPACLRRSSISFTATWSKAIQHPDTKELFAKGGAEASGIPPAEMAREVKRLDERWSGVIRKVGVKLD